MGHALEHGMSERRACRVVTTHIPSRDTAIRSMMGREVSLRRPEPSGLIRSI